MVSPVVDLAAKSLKGAVGGALIGAGSVGMGIGEISHTILKEIDDLAGGYTPVHSYISEYEPGKIWNAWEEGMGRIYEWDGSKEKVHA